jgi:hypothetical protein
MACAYSKKCAASAPFCLICENRKTYVTIVRFIKHASYISTQYMYTFKKRELTFPLNIW